MMELDVFVHALENYRSTEQTNKFLNIIFFSIKLKTVIVI